MIGSKTKSESMSMCGEHTYLITFSLLLYNNFLKYNDKSEKFEKIDLREMFYIFGGLQGGVG